MKLFPPFGNIVHWISQTYHGASESNPSDVSNHRAVDFGFVAGTKEYAVADGVVSGVFTYSGEIAQKQSYFVLDIGEMNVLYVHSKCLVSKGTRLTRGQLIGEVVPYIYMSGLVKKRADHGHIGLQNKVGAPHPGLFDYWDRNVPVNTKYQAIKDIWFKENGAYFRWELFSDLHLPTGSVFAKGDAVAFTKTTNVRTGPAGAVQAQVSAGQWGVIKDGPRRASLDGTMYTWFDVDLSKGSGGGTGWVFDGNLQKYTAPPPPEPVPVDPCVEKIENAKEIVRKEYEDKIRLLKIEHEKRIEELRAKIHAEVPVLEAVASRLKAQ
jgi:hypothetical protein